MDGVLYCNDGILIPTSDTTFSSPQDYHRVAVILAPDGAVDRLDWEWGDGLWPWKRVASK